MLKAGFEWFVTPLDLLWRDLCDWYLEAIKPTIKDDPEQQRILHTVLDAICRLLHPVCPFVTEAMWEHVQAISVGSVDGIRMPPSELAATATWPVTSMELDQGEIDSFELMRELVLAIRVCRAENKVKPNRKIHLYALNETLALAKKHDAVLSSVAGLEKIEMLDDSSSGVTIPFGGERVLLANLMDEADAKKAIARLEEEIETLEKRVLSLRGKLSNQAYVDNAPSELVEETREILAQAESDLLAAKGALST